MIKYVFAAALAVAVCFPSMATAQDCGCCDSPCVKTRKRLALVDVSVERCRLKSVCVTDECGCTTRKLVRVKECVTRKRLALVDRQVDPCRRNCFQKLGDRMRSMTASRACCEPVCAAPAPCGCGCGS